MSVFLQPGAKQKIWWYRFMHNGQVIRRSTKQSNYRTATEMEATHRSRLAKEGDDRIGASERFCAKPTEVDRCPECEKWFDTRYPVIASDGKPLCGRDCVNAWEKRISPVPTLAAFAKEFLGWATAQFQAKPKTLAYYQNSVHRLLEYPLLMSLTLDDKRIPERLTGYKVKRQADGLQVSSINHELRCARRLLRLAVEWGRIESAPKIKLLSGEVHRERVISPEEEARYLAAAPPLLASVATILTDTGLRPEECYRLLWDSITWEHGRHGALLVTHGKTQAARRMIPLSLRVRSILEKRWQEQGQPLEGWVWPAPTKSGHLEPSSLKKQHARALKDSKVRPFVLYSLRHTFLTRLGASGCDVWTLARIAGHGNIRQSMTYVHPSGEAVLRAMGSQVFGHGAKTEEDERQLTA